MKKTIFAMLLAAAFPLVASGATYDDLINSAKMGDTRDVAQMVQRGA